GGGVSRKITSHQDRRRMKEILDQLEIPEGMAVILRTAGMEQEPAEIQRDLEYLLRMWNNIREETLQSTAPKLIYEEANLIKRSMRDMYAPDLSEILVSGQRGYQVAVDFMRTIMPDQLDKVKS
ncbi:ribonuclease E/G, partial [Enterococcus faecium]|uniref:ribonuclease E/G n=1 Tax=Enterococcus faecium TaxID=1352 RepID=UPI003AAEA4EA